MVYKLYGLAYEEVKIIEPEFAMSEMEYETLFYDAKEEDPTNLGISAESLRNFYKFILLHTNLKCPTISLTPDYNIYASWRGEQKRIFSVHFLPNRDVHFVIFIPNVRHPERQIRISGAVTTDILMDTTAPYHICDWISQ